MASTKVGKKGQSKSMNHWLRARVVAQGATIAAVVGGGYVYGNTKQQKEASAAAVEDLRVKEKQEFEERMQAAVEADAVEQATLKSKEQRSEGIWSMLGLAKAAPATEKTSAPSEPTPKSTNSAVTSAVSSPAVSTETTPAKGNGSYWSWLGWGSGSSSSNSNETDKKQ